MEKKWRKIKLEPRIKDMIEERSSWDRTIAVGGREAFNSLGIKKGGACLLVSLHGCYLNSTMTIIPATKSSTTESVMSTLNYKGRVVGMPKGSAGPKFHSISDREWFFSIRSERVKPQN